MKRTCLSLLAAFLMMGAAAQPKFSQPHGLYDEGSLTVAITSNEATAQLRYTTDGSTPTAASTAYTAPLTVTKTTILRAVEVIGDSLSPVTTASYIFIPSVLSQPNNPEGYPSEWGAYTQNEFKYLGNAIADYEMDPEMTNDATLRPKIIEGLKQLPILSIVSDKDNFFSHECDEEHGGIYIFTGPPVGDATGNGWTRPASAELFGGSHDFSTTCGVRLHGGHGRLAEKNPKHSFRLVFKEKYGPKTLKYPLFGENEPSKFDQLVLRCHFGNAWQHWGEGNREKAQYTRDVWARRMQRRIGHTSVNALYVHLFLNGMYWGIYNIAERVDDQFGHDHLGGKKDEIDIIKIEEEGGNHIEAAEGTLDAWNLLVKTVPKAASDVAYQQLDSLLDIDNFIDYMLINQYAGNTDWDHHNWYAIRRHNNDSVASQGFKFLCWDSEIIFENLYENNLSKNNGNSGPTGMFQCLLQNPQFAKRYQRRAKEMLAPEGFLGERSVVEVWDSLYHTIDKALYVEAARWGDFRRDVKPQPSSFGSNYGSNRVFTVDDAYMYERNRLLYNYFPYRSDIVLNSILDYVNIDDFEAPADWVMFTSDMFHTWNGDGKDAQPIQDFYTPQWNLQSNVGGWGIIAGDPDVQDYHYADISQYGQLVLRGKGDGIRILANRSTGKGPWKEIVVDINSNSSYWDADKQVLVLPLEVFKGGVPQRADQERIDDFVHVNAIKVAEGHNATVRGIYLIPKNATSVYSLRQLPADGNYYNLNGQKVDRPSRGVYVVNGKKVIVR